MAESFVPGNNIPCLFSWEYVVSWRPREYAFKFLDLEWEK